MKLVTGYLATLDVLGFAELLYREGYSQQLKAYLDTIDQIVRPASVDAECVLFSDSIVLTSAGDDDKAFRGLVKACAAAFHALIMDELPVRGALAFGRFWRHASGGSVFLAGRPIVEAYRRERAQKWVGITLCPSILHEQSSLRVLTQFPSEGPVGTRKLDLALRLQPASVPFQDAGSSGIRDLSGYAVVPLDTDDDLESAARTLKRMHRSLETLRLKAPDPPAQAKYEATLKWLEEVQLRVEKAVKDLRGRSGRPTTR